MKTKDRCNECKGPLCDPYIELTIDAKYVSLKVDGTEVLKVRGQNEKGEWDLDAKVGHISYHTEGSFLPMTLPATVCCTCGRS